MNSCLKYFFVVFNLVFAIVGALCIGFVIWIRTIEIVDSTLREFAADQFLFYCGIILGGFLILVGLCGALGACYEKKSILAIYLSVILFFVGCELAAIIYAVVGGRNEFVNHLEHVWDNVANETKFVVQATFNCCGFWNASEWEDEYHVSCLDLTFNETEVPFEDPCRDAIVDWFRTNIFVFGGALIATLLFQIFQAIVTCLIIRKIKFDNRIESEDGNREQRKNPSYGKNSRTRAQTNNENSSYANAGYIMEDALSDDTRGRSMRVQRQKQIKNNPDW